MEPAKLAKKGFYYIIWRPVVKSDAEIVSLAFCSHHTHIKSRGLVSIYAFSCPTAQYCNRTQEKPREIRDENLVLVERQQQQKDGVARWSWS